eukprot:gene3050-3512_t
MATAISKGKSEFLRVEKDDIEKVLEKSFHRESDRRIDFLKSLPIFEQWLKSDIKLLSTSANVVEYPSNKVIVKDLRQPQEFAFFIMAGQCHVVRQLPAIVEKLPFGREKVTLATKDEISEVKKTTKIDRRFESFRNLHLVIQVLKKGDYFCVEEDIGKSSIISASKIELLKMPRENLQLQQRGGFYEYIRAYAMRKYPDRVETFQKYLHGRQWLHYKKDLVNDIAKRRKGRLSACLHDVPKSLQKVSL